VVSGLDLPASVIRFTISMPSCARLLMLAMAPKRRQYVSPAIKMCYNLPDDVSVSSLQAVTSSVAMRLQLRATQDITLSST
jgi:hypothetical protein